MLSSIPFVFDDGGSGLVGRNGRTLDCVARAIAIATQTPYLEVVALINARAGKAIAQKGVPKALTRQILTQDFGWKWTSTMAVGQGCTVLAASLLVLQQRLRSRPWLIQRISPMSW